MAWDVAKSLVKLRSQIDELAPRRSRASDGSIGDAAHAAGTSDHNPEDKPWPELDEVDAVDITHDPRNGCDIGAIFESIRLSCLAGRERRVRYLIFDRRYCSANTGWRWWAYTGDNPHTKHGHVSVNDRDDDNTAPWEITARPAAQTTTEEHDMRAVMGNLKGRATLWYGVKGVVPLVPLGSEEAAEALIAAGAVRRTFLTVAGLVEACGLLAGDPDGRATYSEVNRMG